MYDWLQRIFSSSPKEAKAPAPRIEPQAVAPAAPQSPSTASWSQRDEVNANFTNWLFEGNDNSALFTNQIEKDILAALEKTVNSEESGANLVRRMPGVIPQLLNSLRTEYFSGKQLAKKISNDVVLVAEIVRLANSSLFNPAQSITSIEHAVLVLGRDGLRQLITGVAFKPIIDLKSGRFTRTIAPRIWDQSEQCAVASRFLAENQKVDPFEVFLAGLIQNVGLIAALRVIDQMSDGVQPIGSASFCNALIDYARTLSCSIGREWHFPEAVTRAIAEQGITNAKADMSNVGKLLSMGDYLSKMHVLGSEHRLGSSEAGLRKGMSSRAIACLDELKRIQESEGTGAPGTGPQGEQEQGTGKPV